MTPTDFTRRYICRPIRGNGKSTLSMWKIMEEIDCAAQIEAILNRSGKTLAAKFDIDRDRCPATDVEDLL